MVAADDPHELCQSCRLTEVIPDLSKPGNINKWHKMELAKRRLLFSLIGLGLPIWEQVEGKPSLRFRFLEDIVEDEYGEELTVKSTVLTGHSNGVITLNLNEAEDSSRLRMREMMNERYRTLVGHFRHEAGHFYWDWLIRDSNSLHGFRALFGDETVDYTASLKRYYEYGPVENWRDCWISAYASSHPWEDWAESWAHYLHIIDTLDTAAEYGVALKGNVVHRPLSYAQNVPHISFTQIFEDWGRLTKVLNALNRSMGLDDAYPFVIPKPALRKLSFIHEIVQSRVITSPNQNAAIY
jgi:hypothetical protein